MVDSNAGVLNHLKYDSYGKVTSETNAAVDFLFGYTGRENDEETGLLYYRTRYFDPAAGRFVSEDPLNFAAGDTNLQRYVLNSPANWTDPMGLEPTEGTVFNVQQITVGEILGLPLTIDGVNYVGRMGNGFFTPMSRVTVFAFAQLLPGFEEYQAALANNPEHNIYNGSSDPVWDALDYSANFFAGFGDSLSMGITDGIRHLMGWNEGIDHNSWTYFSGEAVEMGGEMIVSAGGAYMRHAAKNVSKRTVGASARSGARRILPGATGAVHHKNTLFGHPAIRGGRRVVSSYFPTGGLPSWVYNHRWNLMRVNATRHAALHARAYRAEILVYLGSHPFLIALRGISNATRHQLY